MSGISQMVSRVLGGGRGATPGTARRGAMPTRGYAGTGSSGRRTQDEAIGKGVRGLLRRFR